MLIIKTGATASLRRLSDSLWSTGTFGTRDSATNIMNDPVIKGLSEASSGQVPPLNIFILSEDGLKPQGCTFFYSLGKDSFFSVKYRAATGMVPLFLALKHYWFMPAGNIDIDTTEQDTQREHEKCLQKVIRVIFFFERIVKGTFFYINVFIRLDNFLFFRILFFPSGTRDWHVLHVV